MHGPDRPPTTIQRVLAIFDAHNLTTSEVIVLVRLEVFANKDDWAFPSQKRLAADCRVSTRWIKNIVGGLQEKGVLEIRRRGRGNEYSIHWGKLISKGELSSPVTGKERGTQFTSIGELSSPDNAEKGNSVTPVTKASCIKASMKASGGRGAFFDDAVKPEEFRDPTCGLKRFGECVSRDRLKDNDRDRLAFMTIWFNIARRIEEKRQQGNRFGSPGGLLTEMLRRDEWRGQGSEADEIAAEAFLKAQRRPKAFNSPADALADQLALEDEGVDDAH